MDGAADGRDAEGAAEGVSEAAGSERSFVDWKIAAAGGTIGALLTFGTMFVLGSVGALEARHLLESSLPTIRFIGSTIATATATILALMLTALSLSHATHGTLRGVHYQRIAQVSWMSAAAIVASTFLLVFLALPLGEAENFPTAWFDRIYYIVIGFTALLGGLFFSVVIMLTNAVRGLISVVRPGTDSHLVVDED